MSLERQTLSALKWTACARFSGQAARWAVTLVVMRLLAPEYYGLAAIVGALVAIIVEVAEVGLAASLVQARELPECVLAPISALLWLLHLGLFVLLVLAAPLAAMAFSDVRLVPLIQAAALQLVFAGASAVPQALATRALEFRALGLIEFTSGMVASVAMLALAWGGGGVWALIVGQLAGSGVKAAMLVARGPNVRPEFRFGTIGGHLGYASRIAFNRIVWSVLSQADALIGGQLLTREELGLYAVALNLATLPMQKIGTIVNQVAFPAIARLQDDTARMRARLLQAVRLLALVAVASLWGLSAVAPEVVHVVLGARWEAAILPLQLATLVVPLRMIAALFNTAVAAVGQARADLRSTLVTVFVWPVCFYACARWGGMNGLAASWLVAVPLTFACNFPRTSRALEVRIREVATVVWPAFAAGVVMWGTITVARVALASATESARLPALIMIGAVAYLAAIALLGRVALTELRRLVLEMCR